MMASQKASISSFFVPGCCRNTLVLCLDPQMAKVTSFMRFVRTGVTPTLLREPLAFCGYGGGQGGNCR